MYYRLVRGQHVLVEVADVFHAWRLERCWGGLGNLSLSRSADAVLDVGAQHAVVERQTLDLIEQVVDDDLWVNLSIHVTQCSHPLDVRPPLTLQCLRVE